MFLFCLLSNTRGGCETTSSTDTVFFRLHVITIPLAVLKDCLCCPWLQIDLHQQALSVWKFKAKHSLYLCHFVCVFVTRLGIWRSPGCSRSFRGYHDVDTEIICSMQLFVTMFSIDYVLFGKYIGCMQGAKRY